jgi:hypothetical protein
MTEEKLKDMLERCEKQFRMPTLFTRFVEPPQSPWVGLTDEEIDVIDEATWDTDDKSWGIHDFARAIEAKLKERNG